jgi:hypothetical protein
LATIVGAWTALPEHVRDVIRTLVESVASRSECHDGTLSDERE